MWSEGAAPALAFLDEPKILQRLRASFAQDASRPSAVGNARTACHGLRCRPNAASRSAAARHREKIGFTPQRYSHCKVIVLGSWNESNCNAEHFTNFSRGSCLSLWRSHEEGHALLTTCAWAGALLATQRHAKHYPCCPYKIARYRNGLVCLSSGKAGFSAGEQKGRARATLPAHLQCADTKIVRHHCECRRCYHSAMISASSASEANFNDVAYS